MTPYIAFELNALDAAPNVARAGGISEDAAVAGLARMWAWCWREKTDTVTPVAVRGFFGADVSEPLAAFGFLEPQNNTPSTYRVKGADRYLRLKETRSANGKKAAERGNLKRGKASPTASNRSPVGLQQPSSKPPVSLQQSLQQPSNSSPVLSSSIELTTTASQGTQTQAEPAQALVRVPSDDAKPPRRKSDQEKFWDYFQDLRRDELGTDWVPDEQWPISRRNKELSDIVKRFEPDLIARAAELYLADPLRHSQAPPCGILNFSRDYGKYLTLAKREAAP